jgi:hypothetical protein
MEETGKGKLESGWEYIRQGKGSWKGAGNIGGRERAIGKRLGKEEAVKGQLKSRWEYGRQGSGSWKGAGNMGGRKRAVGKRLGSEKVA